MQYRIRQQRHQVILILNTKMESGQRPRRNEILLYHQRLKWPDRLAALLWKCRWSRARKQSRNWLPSSWLRPLRVPLRRRACLKQWPKGGRAHRTNLHLLLLSSGSSKMAGRFRDAVHLLCHPPLHLLRLQRRNVAAFKLVLQA